MLKEAGGRVLEEPKVLLWDFIKDFTVVFFVIIIIIIITTAQEK